jgi:predicted N-acetyltransferase YhbS
VDVALIERRPTVSEYESLIASVGFKPRDRQAISAALSASLFSVCAEVDSGIVGMGRVIGDGGLHYYLTDVVVARAYQRRGVGTRIVRALTEFVESIPFKNTCVGIFAVEGTPDFYARFGYKAQRGAAMLRWLNKQNT